MLSLFCRASVEGAKPAADEIDAALACCFKMAPSAFPKWNRQDFVRVIRRFAEIMRRIANQLLTMGPADVIYPDDKERVRDEWLVVAYSTGQWDSIVRHIGPSGEIIRSASVCARQAATIYSRIETF